MEKDHDVLALPLGVLKVDPLVQRRTNQHRVLAMSKKFNEDAMGIITVSQRDDGDYYVVDGQHRVLAAKAALGEDFEVMCSVFLGLSLAEEAGLFRLLNEAQAVKAFDKFRVRIIEGDPAAIYLFNQISNHGYALRMGATVNSFSAVGSLEWVLDGAGGLSEGDEKQAVQDTLTVIRVAWPGEPSAQRGDLVKGIGSLFVRFGQRIDVDRLARLLQDHGTPQRLIGQAKSVHIPVNRNRAANQVATVLVGLYNKYRKEENKLPEWESRRRTRD